MKKTVVPCGKHFPCFNTTPDSIPDEKGLTEMKYSVRGLRRRTEDSWEASFYYRDPATNERKVLYRTVHGKSRKAAERARDEVRIELEQGGLFPGNTPTVNELLEGFIDYKDQSGTIEKSTVRDYRINARFVCRYIGSIRISDLTMDDVNEMMGDQLADGYAPKSVAKPFRLLKQSLDYAVMRGVIPRNVCDYCKPPKRNKSEINALCRSERTRMLELARFAQPNGLAVAIEIALTTGMRRGEVCALRWSDLNDDGSITVRHALGAAPGGYYLKGTKTGKNRNIPLTKKTLNLLYHIKEGRELRYNELGVPAPEGYICGTDEPEARPYNPDRLSKDFAAFAKMNGFNCSFGDLRHTFATMMIAEGVDVRTVSSYLGHASPSMTLDVYADVDPEAKRAAIDKINSAFDKIEAKKTTDFVRDKVLETPQAGSVLPTYEKSHNPALELLLSFDPKEIEPELMRTLLDLAKRCEQ